MMTPPSADSAASKMLGADLRAPYRGGEGMNGGNAMTDDGQPKETDWLRLAKLADDQSANYYEAHLRGRWKTSIAHFNSEHAPGSKYHKNEYAKRSRAFRPKTRSMVLRKEAAAAGAFFAMDDVCGIAPADPDSVRGQAAAAVINAILNHRLEVDVPWFLVSLGNYQTASIQGICASKQYWDYEAIYDTVKVAKSRVDEAGQPVIDPATNLQAIDIADEQRHAGHKIDKPCVVPIPPENLKFHPNADWLDPVNSSPFLVYKFPMFALDVKKKATAKDPKTGKPQWRKVSDQQLMNAARDYAQTVGLRDEQKRAQETSQQADGELREFDTVWVHENFIKKDGEDFTYYTLSTDALLSEAKPIEEVYLHGIRPFQIGIASLEAFAAIPKSKVEQVGQLQRLANEVSNQRIDNVRLAMNGRYWVKEGKKVDLAVLQRSTPGSAVLMSDPMTDVKWDRPADVTASAYQEQDRVNVDFDDLGGLFSAGTVQSDNHLNETVGGMKLMSGDAGAVQEYELKIFAETYMEPVLRQLVKLIQAYETDETIIALGGKLAKAMPKFGVDPVTDDLMDEQLLVSVSVGVGATSPDKRVEKFQKAVDTFWRMVGPLIQTFGPAVLQSPGVLAMAQEIFGAAGYKDAERFLNFGPPPPPQGQDQSGAAGVPSPEVAARVLEVEQSENEKDRENKLAVARIKDMGETTRTVIDDHTKLILKGIEEAANRRVDLPELPHNILRFPQQSRASA